MLTLYYLVQRVNKLRLYDVTVIVKFDAEPVLKYQNRFSTLKTDTKAHKQLKFTT